MTSLSHEQLAQLEAFRDELAVEPENTSVTELALVATERPRGANRPQGAPEHQSVDPVMAAPAEHNVELPDSAQPVIYTRQRGGASRPAGEPSHDGVMGGAYRSVEERIMKNGIKRLYAVDKQGKHHQIKYDTILEAYGHAGDHQGKPAPEVQPEPEEYHYVHTVPESVTEYVVPFPEKRDVTGKAETEAETKVETETEAPTHQPVAHEVLVEETDAPVVEPVEELSEPSLRDRVKRIWSKGRDALLKAYVNVENRIVAPQRHHELSEKELQRRRWALNGAIGAMVVYRVWAMHNGMHSGGSGSAAQEALNQHAQSGGSADGLKSLLTGHGLDSNSHETVSGLTGHGAHNQVAADHVAGGLTGHTGAHEATAPRGQLELTVHRGDMPWDVLHRTGMPDQAIMQHLDDAAKNSGLDYSWHGSGDSRWLEVAGHSDTKTVMHLLQPYIKR